MVKAPSQSPDRPLSIVYQTVDGLKPFVRNARTHSKARVQQIANSILTFGFTNPILTDETGEIIAGHGRLLAAKSLNLAEVPTIVLRHLSEDRKRALRIGHDPAGGGAKWTLFSRHRN